MVYSDAVVAPSLTRTMFPKLWDPLLDGHFKRFAEFEHSCHTGTLAAYSFIEPSFLTEPKRRAPASRCSGHGGTYEHLAESFPHLAGFHYRVDCHAYGAKEKQDDEDYNSSHSYPSVWRQLIFPARVF
jgi:hypothetical protein